MLAIDHDYSYLLLLFINQFIDPLHSGCRGNDHYDEPEVKVSNKLMPFSVSGSSGSSSSSTHQSNHTGYSSLTNGPALTTASVSYPSTFNPRLTMNSSIHHAIMSSDGLYAHTTASSVGNNGHPVIGNPVNHVNELLPSANTFHSHHDAGESVYGVYGATRSATLRHLPSRLEFNNSRNDPINGSINSKY